MKSKLVFLNQCFDKTRLRNLISWVLLTKDEKRTIETIKKLKDLGFNYATRAGISLSVDDLKIPSEKVALVSQAKQQVSLADRESEKGNVTSIEKLQQLVDTWHRTSETLKQTVVSNFQAIDKLSPVYMMAFSGARGNISQVRQLAGMRGLMADPQGQIIGFPIRSNFREGLTLTEYMISCYGARKGLVDTALRTADAGYLTRRLVDVSQHMVVTASTCATRKGIVLSDLAISGKSALSLRDRLVGRVLAEDIYSIANLLTTERDSSKALVRRQDITKVGKRNQEISATLASQIAANQKKVTIRSPLTCSIRHGVCQLCYGWSLSEGRLVNLGEAVGIIAAQSIGEPGTQLTMRTFHTGGVFSGDVMGEIRAPYEGTVHFRNPLQGLLIRTSHGKIAFLTKSAGELILIRQNQTPSLARGSMATPFPFLEKMYERGGGQRTPHNLVNPNSQKQTTQDTSEDEIEKLFPLETSTIVFVRQHEKVSRTQLIAEYSSMGTEINETIEAKRTLFANNAGQISFANSLTKSEIQGNGNIIQTSQTLGSVWILSGKKPSPLKLLDILEKGTNIVNQSTIIARVPCPNVDLSLVSPLVSKTTLIIPHLPLKVTSFERTRVNARILAKDEIKFLPSILYSWILLPNINERRESSITQYNQSLSLINNKETPLRSSVFDKNGKGIANEPLFRPILLTNNFSTSSIRTKVRASKGKVFPLDSASTQSVILTDPTFSALCIQPSISNYPRTTRSTVRVQGQGNKGHFFTFSEGHFFTFSEGNQKSFASFAKVNRLGISADDTRIWIFSPLYKAARNGIAWFDTRFLNKNLNLGEVIWVRGEPVRPRHDRSTLTTRWQQKNERRLFTPVNPRVGQPSSYINTNYSPSFIHFYKKWKECRVWNSTNNRDIFSRTHSFAKARNFFFKQGKIRNDKQSSSIKLVNPTKAWIVAFEKNQNVTKEKVLRLQSSHFIVASLVTPSIKNKRFSWERHNSTKGQELKQPFMKLVQSSNKRVQNVTVSPSTEDRPFCSTQQTNKEEWVYCPQGVKKVSALHESIDFYRNRQVDNFTFDSSIVYLKARYNLELVYHYQRHLQLIASKLFLFLEGDTSRFSTQTVRSVINGWRPKFPTPYFKTFTSTFQDTNRQYSAVYLGVAGKKSSSLGKLVLHFAGPQTDKLYYLRPSGNARKTRDFSSGFGKVILRLQVKPLKRDGLLFLRKWMQIPQSYALHERLVSLENKRNSFSFSDSEDPMEPYKICQQEITSDEEVATSVIPPTIFSTPQRLKNVAIEPQTNLQRVKISVFGELRKGAALLFDTRNCFHSTFVDKNRPPLAIEGLQENDKTERYKRLVWKNLINCKPFLLLRTCQLQVQIVSNTKARHLLSLPANHPLTWHSLIRSSNVRKSWRRKENSTNLSLVSRVETQEHVNSQPRQKASFHQLNLRQQIHVVGSDRRQSFFDFISHLESETSSTLPIVKPQLGVSTLLQADSLDSIDQVTNSSITAEVQIGWPYSSKAKILAFISKGLSVPLPSKKTLTRSYKTESSICILSKKAKKERTHRPFQFLSKTDERRGVELAGMKESLDQEIQARASLIQPIFYTFQFRFVTKVKVSLLMAKCKPNKFLLLPLATN